MFEQSAVRFELWRSMLAAFDAHSWLQVASILLRSWRGTGFGDGMSVESAALIKTGSVELQGVFVQCVQEAPQLKSEFLNRVLDNLNWTMTEFGPPHFACPTPVHPPTPSHPPAQHPPPIPPTPQAASAFTT